MLLAPALVFALFALVMVSVGVCKFFSKLKMPTRRRRTKLRRRRRRWVGATRTRWLGTGKNAIRLRGWKGTLALKRVVNMCTVSPVYGVTVNGGLASFGSNMVFSTGALPGTMYYAGMSINFQLRDVPNASEITSLWDRYKLVGVKLRLIPYATSVESGAAVNASYQQTGLLVHSVVDFDDSNVPTATDAGIDALRQYPSYRCENINKKGGRGLSRYIKPRLAVAAFANSAFTSYKNEKFSWIDMAYPAVEGYGYKAVFEAVGPGGTFNFYFKMEATYYIVVRDMR